ncbi:MAG: N-acetyltransferase family protein [Candidatus Limnocylindrales bacterium]
MDALELRRARPDDAKAIGDVYLASFRAAYAFPGAHTDQEVRDWLRDVVLPAQEVWVAVAGDLVVALMALSSDMLDQLYVAPGWTGRGIGSALLALAKDRRPAGLDLYTFQVNAGARRFYERHGFVVVTSGDSSGNEERQPDLRYSWRPDRERTGGSAKGRLEEGADLRPNTIPSGIGHR